MNMPAVCRRVPALVPAFVLAAHADIEFDGSEFGRHARYAQHASRHCAGARAASPRA